MATEIQQKLTDEERKEITLLCFAETILTTIANRQQPKTRRHNQLVAALERLDRVDKTYHGYLPEDYYANAEATLQKIEDDLMALYRKDGGDGNAA